MTKMLLLAIALIGTPPPQGETPADDGAATNEGSKVEPGAAPKADGEKEAPPLRSEARSPDLLAEPHAPSRAGARHALALGWNATSFFSEEGSHYTFHSASIGYIGSYGSRGLFVHLMALLPLQARQSGRVYATGDYYGPRTGGDLLVGWQWRWRAAGAELEAGPGFHAALLVMPGKTGYRDFSALPLGIGVGSTARWKLGAEMFSRPIVLGAYGSFAYDVHDPLRSGDLAHGLTSTLGMLVSLEGSP